MLNLTKRSNLIIIVYQKKTNFVVQRYMKNCFKIAKTDFEVMVS